MNITADSAPDYADDVDTLASRELLSAIIQQALIDAQTIPTEDDGMSVFADKARTAQDAIDFLITNRCQPYLEMLGINWQQFSEQLVDQQFTRCGDFTMTSHQRDAENQIGRAHV